MKKLILMGFLTISFSVRAQIITGDTCGDDCRWTFDTDTGKLTISGTGDMYDFGLSLNTESDYWNKNQAQTPWKQYDQDITNIVIDSGITKIGRYAFYNDRSLQSVSMADTIIDAGPGAFQYAENLTSVRLSPNLDTLKGALFFSTRIENLVIPENISYIDQNALHGVKNVILEGDAELLQNAYWGCTGGCIPRNIGIYCISSNKSCDALKADEKIGDKIRLYDKENGVYELNGKFYASLEDMQNEILRQEGDTTDYTCGTDKDKCKAMVLKNKGLCKGIDSDCKVFVSSANAGQMLKIGSKTYQSLDALLKGDYDVRRIYTVDEANFVAGKTNRVSIKYR